jgi:hypothetical protein
MAYGNILADVVQSSTTNTPPVFKDGTGIETGQLCRAWANFSSASTPIVGASFGVSSVTKTTTGSYRLNFTTAMPDTNYAVVGVGSTSAAYNGWMQQGDVISGTKTTTYTGVYTINTSVSLYDAYTNSVAIFR